MDWKANAEAFSSISTTGFALILTIVSSISYARLRNRRGLWIASGFLIFAVKGVFLTYASFQSAGTQPWILPVASLDLLILLLMYLSMRVP